MAINFFSSKVSERIRNMYAPSDDIKILIGNETDEIIEKRFNFLLQRCKKKFKRIKVGHI